MDVHEPDTAAAAIAAAIGDPTRARMLYSLVDGRARTSTELAAVADVTPSTASVHLQRLRSLRLVQAIPQGKHRYYRLESRDVAAALEALQVLTGSSGAALNTRTPHRLRSARTCYDHIAGMLGVSLYDRFLSKGWLSTHANGLAVTHAGRPALERLGVDVDAATAMRRRFAFACLDWSERRPHLGGALAATVLTAALRKRWVVRDLDSRALRVTAAGQRELLHPLGIK
jgi:DNA-binding transcriptional ArsR family regulator